MKQSLRSNQALRMNTNNHQNRERDTRFGLGTDAVDEKKQEDTRILSSVRKELIPVSAN